MAPWEEVLLKRPRIIHLPRESKRTGENTRLYPGRTKTEWGNPLFRGLMHDEISKEGENRKKKTLSVSQKNKDGTHEMAYMFTTDC